ncbi:Dihydroorotate dehydrogenase [Prochlorococcus marinus subsp. pastoris str. CCMP1986]|uniref:Dihydroorotate dehydrogenase (quinone) n=1 Tax=Prochlorococcus marinus subsp. pastoris (strain CCMP1986 / NIES-2087 / MED4) TaxID=59919 RepID=Q7V386_PROMP|nr:quinone-dependent dihydroorotate dehydrogenase [Prochlorococcus marinus]KGF88048.1 Dihydroorotate dehydrogenase [Prochlorococcus marinus str. EQPAC1]CAE18658.1 Dihydroorotate dehydrogenase [Prochlorococcus marinus subsp. pastoris str. CCMP1986]
MIDQKGIFNNIYKNLVTPILKKDTGIDAEYLTNFSLSLLTFSSNNRDWPLISRIIKSLNQEFCVVDKRLHQKICGIDFCNPVGLAAGFDKNGNAANIWKEFGFGFAEIGTVTKFAQSGNPKPRLFRLAKEQAALNRMGFNNHGAENLVKNFLKQNVDLKKHRKNNCLGINFGKSKITSLSKATEDYLTSLKLLIPYCDYAVINVSSPNTEGLRKLQDPILLKELLREVKNLDNCPPLFVKIAPDLSYKDIEDICQLIIDENIDGIIATNTSLDRLGFEQRKIKQTGLLLSEENGGLSGKPLQRKANKIIRHIHNIDNNINLIGVGGIDSPESAWERICSGASLVQIYTGWIYKGPQLVPNILNGILKQINIHQLSNVREAIGSNLEWIE